MLLAAGVAAITAHRDVSRNISRALRYVFGAEVVFVVVMAAAGALYQAISITREQRLYPPPGQLLDVGGYRLHLYCSGEGGPTVVLDYGRAGSFLDWYYVQPQVARFTRVCSYDRGGYGYDHRGYDNYRGYGDRDRYDHRRDRWAWERHHRHYHHDWRWDRYDRGYRW